MRREHMRNTPVKAVLFASLAILAPWAACPGQAQDLKAPAARAATAAGDIANFFRQVGDQIYQDCIFELSEEQLDVQHALIEAYIRQGADSFLARQLAVKQIQPPALSERCEEIRSLSKSAPPVPNPWIAKPLIGEASPKGPPEAPAPTVALASKSILPQWDCASGVDFVTIRHKGFQRKLTNGEICNPFEDVVRKVPDTVKSFRLGYTIESGRLFIVADDLQSNGRTIAWAISGREACRNNPDPDCLAARAVGPLPPGEYSFASDADHRVSWGPTAKRMVAGVYLGKLWNRERYSPAQAAAILARRNIAIHVRLKGEMSEACLGLEPNGWAYVSSLIAEGRATGLNVYIDEPYPRMAEAPPVVKASSFSLSSLFKQ